jgi:hypothetical protein
LSSCSRRKGTFLLLIRHIRVTAPRNNHPHKRDQTFGRKRADFWVIRIIISSPKARKSQTQAETVDWRQMRVETIFDKSFSLIKWRVIVAHLFCAIRPACNHQICFHKMAWTYRELLLEWHDLFAPIKWREIEKHLGPRCTQKEGRRKTSKKSIFSQYTKGSSFHVRFRYSAEVRPN